MSATSTLRPLGDLVELKKATQAPADLGDENVQHFSIPAYDQGAEPERVQASSIRSNKLRLEAPAVLVSKINPHIPRCWLAAPDPESPALASTEFLPLVPMNGDIDLAYLFAACSSRPFQRTLASLVTGTSTSHQRVKPRDCLSIKIPVVGHDEQQRIGSTFEAIERRLAVTRRVSEISDSIIQAAFEDVLGAGTGNTALADLANVSFGVSYRSADLHGDHQALVTLKCFGRTGQYRPEGLKAWNGEPKSAQVVEPGEVVVAQTDLTQAADVLGRSLLVRESPFFDRLVASLDVAVVRPGADVCVEWLYGLLSQPAFRGYCRSRANGTTVLHLSRKALPEYRVVVPPKEIQARLAGTIRPAIDRMLMAEREAQALHGIRQAFIVEAFGA